MSEMKPNPENEKKGGALPPLGSAADGGSKLPSFKSSLSKKKPIAAGGGEGKSPAAVPTWGSAGVDKLAGAPMFRGAGAMAAKKSLLGRLKGLKTKDMAFIAAGLGVLVMAPLAEYLISDGADNGAIMSEGFDRKGGFFAEPQDLYEAGVEGIAPGGLMGRDTDVITPLNVRDPSSLIMAPGGQREEPAPTASIDEPKRDAPKDDTDWKKIIDSAKSGVTEATKRVKLPTPSVKMTGALSGLKGLAGGGSTQARLSLAAPTTPGAQRPSGAGSNLSRTQALPGFRGAGRSLAAGGGTASGGFGRASNPGGTTGEAASAFGGISGGGKGTGYGSPTGDGEPTKNPGGNGTKDNKTLGENLAFLRAKMNMEKAIDLKWAKKRYNELERKKMLEQMAAQTAQQAFMKILDRLLKGNEGEKGKGGGGSPGGGGKPEGGDPGGKTDEQIKDEAGDLPGANPPRTGLPRGAKADDATKGVTESEKIIKDANSVLAKLDGKGVTAEADALIATGEPVSKALGAVIKDGGKLIGDSKTAAEKALESAPEAVKPMKEKNTETKTALDAMEQAQIPTKVGDGVKPAKENIGTLKNTGSDPVTLSGSKSGDMPEVKPELKTVAALGSKPKIETGAVDSYVAEAEKLKATFAAAAKDALGTGGAAQLPMTLTKGNEKIDALIVSQIKDHQTTLKAVQEVLDESYDLTGKAVTSYGDAKKEADKIIKDYGSAKTAWDGFTWKAGEYSDKTDKTYTGKLAEATASTEGRDGAKTAIEKVKPDPLKGLIDSAKKKLGSGT